MYKSAFERQVAKFLRSKKIKFAYEPTVVRFIQPQKERKYKPDFRIETKEGTVFIEAKGKLTIEDRKKLMWVKEQHPELNLVIVFMNANVKLRKGSKTTYGEWATKAGFKWYDYKDWVKLWN